MQESTTIISSKRIPAFLFSCLLLLFSAQVMASAETDFEQGARYFKAGDYNRAISYFENARKQGMRNVAIFYNLGSSYFKTGDYQKAAWNFRQVASYPDMKSLAEYNLGLIALRLNNSAEARQKFESVIALQQDEKITALARQKLREMPLEEKSWYVVLSAGIGYDDNITALPDSMTSNVSDMFYELFMAGDAVLSGRYQQGWIAGASLFRIDYDDADTYDEGQYGVFVRKSHRLDGWLTDLALHVDQSSYGGDDFQSLTRVEANAKRSLSRTERLYFKYRYDDINSDNPLYDYLQGWRQILRPEYRQYTAKTVSMFYYELELNDRQDTLTASYSPVRHTLRGRYTYRLNDVWHLNGDLSWRLSNYEDVGGISREDERWRVGAHIDYLLDKTLKIRTKVIYMDNESTLDVYDYNKTVISVGLSKSF